MAMKRRKGRAAEPGRRRERGAGGKGQGSEPGTRTPEARNGKVVRRRGFAKPGDSLGFARELKERGAWPPKKCHPDEQRKRPVMTPYVVVPVFPADSGARPLPAEQANNSASIEIVDLYGTAVTTPVARQTYRIRARIINRGPLGAFGGLANFYVAAPSTFDVAAGTPGATLPALGYTGFLAMPGRAVVVECPRTWTPADDAEARSAVVVHAFDPFIDGLRRPFDARQDRHVGRRDPIPDFSGVWDGMESANQIHQVPTKIRFVITQAGLNVNVSIFGEVGWPPGFPATPQDQGSAAIVNGVVHLSTTEYWGAAHTPFAQNDWVLNLASPHVLHFTHHKHYLMPGDTRPDTFTQGDLPKL